MIITDAGKSLNESLKEVDHSLNLENLGKEELIQ